MANTDAALRRLTSLIAHLLLERTENAPRVFRPVDNRWFDLSLDRFDHLTLYQKFKHHKYPVAHLAWMVAVAPERFPLFNEQLILRYGVRDETLAQLGPNQAAIHRRFRHFADAFLRRDLAEAEGGGFPLAFGTVVMISARGELERAIPL